MNTTDDFATAFIKKKKEKKRQQEEDDKKTTEQLQQEHDQLEDDALESTRRALNQVMETEDTGIKTAQKLRQQGDQLDNIYATLSHTDANAIASRKDAKRVRKYNNICGIHFKNPFNKDHKRKEEMYQKERELADTKLKGSKRKDLDDVLLEHELGKAQNAKPQQAIKYKTEKDREIDENLDQIGNIVGNLKLISDDINEEIDAQDIKLEAIELVSNHADTNIREAQAKIRKFAY